MGRGGAGTGVVAEGGGREGWTSLRERRAGGGGGGGGVGGGSAGGLEE